jgi:septum formation protein
MGARRHAEPDLGGVPLVLASASPRRRRLLALLGVRFVVAPVDVDESIAAGESGVQAARRLADAKAQAGGVARPDRIVLAADTVVLLDGRVLGKPAHADEAREMLRALRGRRHRVVTAVTFARAGRLTWQSATETTVEMRRYDDADLERYVAGGQPLDKAGGYAVQDPDFRPAARVEGCYPNVVGLPLCEVLRGLRSLGLGGRGPPDPELAPPCALCDRAARVASGE